MSSQSSKESKANPGWQGLPALFKEWKEVIVILGGALAATLTTVGVKAQGIAQIIGYAVVVFLLVIAGYIAHRVKRRREFSRQRAQLLAAFETRKQQRTAFRGLYPYQEGDILPGHQRKREAQTIFTQVTDIDFCFGIICGDSGSGKTSVLRCALQSHLKDAEAQTGIRVLYIGNPRELSGSSDQSKHLKAADRLQRQLVALKLAVTEISAGSVLIIVIDQFEQFFIEYKTELRGQLGSCLNELIHASPPARILCAVRSDYLMDMRDLAPQLPDPISVKTLFTLKNFTLEQAADVINECATLDGVALDHDLPGVIAEDLSEDGYIRPPELQIVCTALISNPTVAEYRRRGGARGILSHYIQNAIAICGDQRLGSQILRTFCNLPAHSKRNPQTIDELLSALALPSNLDRQQASKLISDILVQFEVARLVVVDTRAPEETYVLVHDYLVDAVAAATSSDDETRAERANQLLQYYVSEHRTDPNVRIPLRNYRFIKRYAAKALLAEPRTRRLLKATQKARIANIAALLLLVVIATFILLTALNTHYAWEPTQIARLVPEAEGPVLHSNLFLLPGGDRVLTLAATSNAAYARVWEMKTAKQVFEKKADDFLIDNERQFLIVEDRSAHSVYALGLPGGETHLLPVSAAAIDGYDLRDLVTFGASSGFVLISQVGRSHEPRPQEQGVTIWSILEDKQKVTINSVRWWRPYQPYLSQSANYLVASYWTRPNASGAWRLWNARTGQGVAVLNDAEHNDMLAFAVDEGRNKFVIVTRQRADARLSAEPLTVQLKDLQTGRLLRKQSVPLKEPRDLFNVDFSNQGDFIILASGIQSNSDKPLAILNASDLLPATQSSGRDLQWGYGPTHRMLPTRVSWANDAGTYVWDTNANTPKFLPGLTLQPLPNDDGGWREKLLINDRGDRALVARQRGQVELFDLNGGRKIGELGFPGDYENVGFTYDGRAFTVGLAGGMSLLYSLDNGRQLAALPNVGGGFGRGAYYDADCNRVNVWTEDGRVLRYTENLRILERWSWPSTKCLNQLHMTSINLLSPGSVTTVGQFAN